jgi:hypothetical protein
MCQYGRILQDVFRLAYEQRRIDIKKGGLE